MKSIWNGTISFGLVTIPVRLYSATETKTLGFKMLCHKCHAPLSYKRICSSCGKEIPWERIVKGLKLKSGKYFIITPEKLKELRPEKTDAIDVVEFVDFSEIKLIYLNNHYYLAPEKKGEKAFFLFQKALEETNKVGIGRFVMRDKEYICALTPLEDAILLTTMNYAYEIRDAYSIAALRKVPKVQKKEIDLAKKLIKQLTKKTFNLEKFKDTFSEKLKKAIKKGKKVTVKKAKKVTKVTRTKKEETLMASLKASLIKPTRKTKRPVARAAGRK